tara:strand:+ start:753 stop:1136 length:384 start_codon:yes stop_codon:yes gene_type:complete
VTKFLKLIFFISLSSLVILSLYPGSLIGFLLYGDLGRQPEIINNPFGTTLNHFISYLYLSILGFFLYSKTKHFQKFIFFLFFLALTLEFFHLIIPNRSFEWGDLIGNILGVLVAYFVIKIYLFLNRL